MTRPRPAFALTALLLVTSCGGTTNPSAPTPQAAPPVLLCPAPIVTTGALAGMAVVQYPQPSLISGLLPAQVSCTPQAGTMFPVGTTTVQCSVTDALSRQSTCAFAVTVEAQAIGVMRFLAFGDSVTEGQDGTAAMLTFATIDPTTSYPTGLEGALNGDFPGQDIVVINAGLGGEPASCDNSPDFCGVGRLPSDLGMQTPQVLLLLHGYNDLLGEGVDAVDAVVEAMRDMVRIAKMAGVPHVFLATITPGRTAVGPRDREIDATAIVMTNNGLAAVAVEEAVPLVDLYAAFAGRELELIEDDGLHPTASGNAVIAETFYTRILEVLSPAGL